LKQLKERADLERINNKRMVADGEGTFVYYGMEV